MTDIVEVPRNLLESLLDPDSCDIDHNNSCQSHGYFYMEDDEKCPQAVLTELLDTK